MNTSEVCSKIKDTMQLTDELFNAISNEFSLDKKSYDEMDSILFFLFRKLIVRWSGVMVLVENHQSENADVLVRTIFELEKSLEFILLEDEVSLINNRISAFEYNRQTEQLKLAKVAGISNEKVIIIRKEVFNNDVLTKVESDIEKLKNERGKYKFYWADLYCKERLSNFTDVFKYINRYYKLDSIKSYNDLSSYVYKLYSTEVHSNLNSFKLKKGSSYLTDYTSDKARILEELLVLFDTILSDFLSYLSEKHNIKLLENDSDVQIIRNDILSTVLKK
ncbi:TPA: DUF5677 domain-containing protein [Listeria monocytogenes]